MYSKPWHEPVGTHEGYWIKVQVDKEIRNKFGLRIETHYKESKLV